MDDTPGKPRLTLRTEIIEDNNPYILARAWSLSVLLSFLPESLDDYYHLVMGPIKSEWVIEYNYITVTNNACRIKANNLIEACVKTIEWLVKNGYKLNLVK